MCAGAGGVWCSDSPGCRRLPRACLYAKTQTPHAARFDAFANLQRELAAITSTGKSPRAGLWETRLEARPPPWEGPLLGLSFLRWGWRLGACPPLRPVSTHSPHPSRHLSPAIPVA